MDEEFRLIKNLQSCSAPFKDTLCVVSRTLNNKHHRNKHTTQQHNKN